MNMELISALPTMKSGDELKKALTTLPEYSTDICNRSAAERLIALSELYNLYIPSEMSSEIYSKLYLALLRSLQKKCTLTATRQQAENRRMILQKESRGIIGGSDSFTIIGVSGIGKSSAINRAISLITDNRIIEITEPYAKIIPCVVVQCPFDSSVKGLLYEILRKVDECLDSKYYANALRARATTDMLIGSVSQVAVNHIGLLVVDEIQNVANNKNGKSLIGSLTQLINNSGISICMVGTPESSIFFEQALQLARRSLGLKYGVMAYDGHFREFCGILFSYRYVCRPAELTDAIVEWLYEHSAGITSVVVSLAHDAQEIAILTGKETLDLETLNAAYEKRLTLLHDYIEPHIQKNSNTSKLKGRELVLPNSDGDAEIENQFLISTMAIQAKSLQKDIVGMLKAHMPIVEVSL